MKPIPFRHFIPGIIWFCIVTILICIPGEELPQMDEWSLFLESIYFDKLVHCALFGVMMLLFSWPFQRSNRSITDKKKSFLRNALLICCWGLITECIQLFVPFRSFDLADWAADSVGILMVFAYFGFFTKG